MSGQLRLQKRDDPLAITTPMSTNESGMGEDVSGAAAPLPRSRPKRSAAPKRQAALPSDHAASPTYDDDRLEQTGWRMYETLLEQVRIRAEELTAAGIPTSAAALAAATLHSYLPRTPEAGADVMRVYRQATAGRQRARRA